MEKLTLNSELLGFGMSSLGAREVVQRLGPAVAVVVTLIPVFYGLKIMLRGKPPLVSAS